MFLDEVYEEKPTGSGDDATKRENGTDENPSEDGSGNKRNLTTTPEGPQAKRQR